MAQQRKPVSKPGLKPLPPPAPADVRDPDLQQWIEKVKALPDVREEKVCAIRAALADGSYDVDARLRNLCHRWPDDLSGLADSES